MLRFELVDSTGTKFRDEVEACFVETPEGQIGILPNHQDLVALTVDCDLKIIKNGREKVFKVERGILKCFGNKLLIAVEEVLSDG
ncbi:MAG: F0F1 ATP synthase subunit epsilon [Deltaproteobacteria bacterium]|nr:F0F1 ATP synthase subunit epsilon [Deltaproteobacteria bacterium]